MEEFVLLLFFSIILFFFMKNLAALDNIPVNLAMSDGETLVSAGDMFELGFISPGSSKNRYLGICYKNISPPTVPYRETPLTSTSGMLKVGSHRTLMLLNDSRTVIWSSDSSVSVIGGNPLARLLDTGNLDLQDDYENLIWQSFDYPGDTLLRGMIFGKDLWTGVNRRLMSWKSLEEPSLGKYVLWMDTSGFPQVFARKGSVLRLRLGPWNGHKFNVVG